MQLFSQKQELKCKNIKQCPIRYILNLNSGNLKKLELQLKKTSLSKIRPETSTLKGYNKTLA